MTNIVQRHITAALVLCILFVRAPATAADAVSVCYDAHESGQLLRKRGEWKNARAKFAICAQAHCPSLVARDCVAWVADIEKREPTLLFAIVDAEGNDVPHGRIEVDGAVVDNEGQVLELDPGTHVVRVTFPDDPPLTERVVVREGERGRRIALVRRQGGLRDDTSSKRVPLASVILGGASVASLATFGVLGFLGKSRENELAESCGTRCSDDAVSSVREKYILADVALGVAVVTSGIALAIWLTQPTAKARARAAALSF